MEQLQTLPQQYCDKLTEDERQAIESLKDYSTIAITKADKSLTIVNLDEDDYITEANIQLFNGSIYSELDRIPDV